MKKMNATAGTAFEKKLTSNELKAIRGGDITVDLCVDLNPNCATWAGNGFCANSFYTIVQRRLYCARTCNLCLLN